MGNGFSNGPDDVWRCSMDFPYMFHSYVPVIPSINRGYIHINSINIQLPQYVFHSYMFHICYPSINIDVWMAFSQNDTTWFRPIPPTTGSLGSLALIPWPQKWRHHKKTTCFSQALRNKKIEKRWEKYRKSLFYRVLVLENCEHLFNSLAIELFFIILSANLWNHPRAQRFSRFEWYVYQYITYQKWWSFDNEFEMVR